MLNYAIKCCQSWEDLFFNLFSLIKARFIYYNFAPHFSIKMQSISLTNNFFACLSQCKNNLLKIEKKNWRVIEYKNRTSCMSLTHFILFEWRKHVELSLLSSQSSSNKLKANLDNSQFIRIQWTHFNWGFCVCINFISATTNTNPIKSD